MSNWIEITDFDGLFEKGDVVWTDKSNKTPTPAQLEAITPSHDNGGWLVFGLAKTTISSSIESGEERLFRNMELASEPASPKPSKTKAHPGNIRPDCPIFDGWVAISNDEPIISGDKWVQWHSGASAYTTPEYGYLFSTGDYRIGSRFKDNWTCEKNQKSMAVYRKIGYPLQITEPAGKIIKGVSRSPKWPLNKHHSRPLPLP